MGKGRVASLFVLALVLTTCAPKLEPIRAKSSEKAPLRANAIPAQILGLSVGQETLQETLQKARRAHYVQATALFSIRKPDNELQATLQVSEFRPGEEFRTENFRRAVVAQIGATQPRTLRIGEQIVHFTTAKGLVIAIWFTENHLFTLAMREGFERPKTLVREALAIRP